MGAASEPQHVSRALSELIALRGLARFRGEAELAALWGLSAEAVRRMFLAEPGVFVLGRSASTRRQRQYRTLRIPASVAERVHRRFVNR